MDVIIEQIKARPIAGVCSVITLAEVLPVPLRSGRNDLVDSYKQILLESQEFTCVLVTQSIAERAAKLRASYNLRTPDALRLASAINTGCDAFLTNDFGIKRVTDIRVLVLDDLQLDPPANANPETPTQ